MASPLKTVGYSSLIWNTVKQVYTLPGHRRRLAQVAVLRAIKSDVEREAGAMQELLERVRSGSLPAPIWEEEMRLRLKNLTLNHGAAAWGGFHNMSQQVYGRGGAWLREQYGYLSQAAARLQDDPTAQINLDLWANSGRLFYESERGHAHKAAGFDQQRNVPHSRESCHQHGNLPGCTTITAYGWHPIGTTAPIGRRACGPADECTMEYRRSKDAKENPD